MVETVTMGIGGDDVREYPTDHGSALRLLCRHDDRSRSHGKLQMLFTIHKRYFTGAEEVTFEWRDVPIVVAGSPEDKLPW